MLSTAKALTQLRLSFINGETVYRGHSTQHSDQLKDMFGCLGSLQFPCLSLLDISCDTTEQKWIEFLGNNANSLTSLSVKDCRLLGAGSWESLISRFPSILQLENIYFEGIRDSTIADYDEAFFEDGLDWKNDSHSWDVREYVLHGGHRMPSLRYDRWMEDNGLIDIERESTSSDAT